MQIGIQVSSVKPLLQNGEQVRAAFRNMAGLGCKAVQLQWIDKSVSAEEIAAALKENGLVSVGVQDFYTLVREDLEYYVNLIAVTGGPWLCVSRIPEEYKSRQGLESYRRELLELMAYLKTRGQKLCFHPVTADFRAVPGMDPVAWLMDHLPELQLCLDLYHLNRNCGDMPGYIRRYAGRICGVHFKDAVGDTLVPAGRGEVNWNGVVAACREAGVPYGFAEQETWDRDPYECLGEAMAWIAGQ